METEYKIFSWYNEVEKKISTLSSLDSGRIFQGLKTAWVIVHGNLNFHFKDQEVTSLKKNSFK